MINIELNFIYKLKLTTMKKIILILSSLLIIALSTVPVYSQSDNSELNSIIAYGYVAYDSTSTLPTGPCFFDLDDPSLITSLAPGTSGNFISAGTWADGKWYGEEYEVGNLYEINTLDGSMTFIGSSGYPIQGIAYDGITMYGCSSIMFGSINLVDGAGTIIGNMGNFQNMIGLACDSAGNIYGVDFGDDNLYSINKTTGAATVIGPLGIDLAEYGQDMEFDKNNDVLYLAAYLSSGGALYTINTSTGAATLVGEFMNGIQIDAFAIPYADFSNDLGIVSIPSPSSGVVLTSEEPVVVHINNFGANAQSNFNVSYTVDGGTAVTETITDTINSGETYEYTFTETVDLSAFGTYAIEVCTNLSGDENPGNNCMTKIVVNFDYCDASTINYVERISNVLCGSIDKASAWQTGVADYTDIYTIIEPGMEEDIIVTNGFPFDERDSVAVWVDWNNDNVFQMNSEEEVILINDGTNEIFAGIIMVPAGTADGDYRMRIRLVWSVIPDPCGPEEYGEVEEYTIRVYDATNIDDNLVNNTLVYPNPFSTSIIIEYELTKPGNSIITIFNHLGQKVEIINQGNFQSGKQQFVWDASGLPNGIYFVQVRAGQKMATRKIVKMK